MAKPKKKLRDLSLQEAKDFFDQQPMKGAWINKRKMWLHHFFGGACGYCNEPLDVMEPGSWVIEHVHVQNGEEGSHLLRNLTVACYSCNASKGSKSVEEFRKFVKDRTIKELSFAIGRIQPFANRKEQAGLIGGLIEQIAAAIPEIEKLPISFPIDSYQHLQLEKSGE